MKGSRWWLASALILVLAVPLSADGLRYWQGELYDLGQVVPRVGEQRLEAADAVYVDVDRDGDLAEESAVRGRRWDEYDNFGPISVRLKRDGWDSNTFHAYGVKALPTTFLIDYNGKVAAQGTVSSLAEKLTQLPE